MNFLNKLVKKFRFIRWLVRNEHNLINRGIGIYPLFSFQNDKTTGYFTYTQTHSKLLTSLNKEIHKRK